MDMEYDIYCCDCKEICKPIKESFNYSGTHCTYGLSGTHYTGRYVSDCCGADICELTELEEESGQAS